VQAAFVVHDVAMQSFHLRMNGHLSQGKHSHIKQEKDFLHGTLLREIPFCRFEPKSNIILFKKYSFGERMHRSLPPNS
jgi:hypothetical protein